MTGKSLPTQFADLTPYLDWALPTAGERHAKRLGSTSEELKSFYDAVVPRLEEILEAVDAWPLGELPESHRPLYDIALSVAEVAPHIELYKGAPNIPFSFEETRFVARHADHETWRGLNPAVVI